MAEDHAVANFEGAIRIHLETCLQYARRQSCVHYKNPADLALDYGVNGTDKFFPLSQLTHEISNDERFKVYVKGDMNV